MKPKIYYIFSDESGSWSTARDVYYVRSWFKISQDNYLGLKFYYDKIKEIHKITTEELKWEKLSSIFKNFPEILYKFFRESKCDFKESKFEIFITFTILKEFYQRKFNIREKVVEFINEMDLEDVQPYLSNISSKVKNSINYVLFLNIYERYHLQNAFERLISKEGENVYYLFIDKPQFLPRDYLALIKEISKNDSFWKKSIKPEIGDSKDLLGIQIADLICGCFYQNLKKKLKDDESKNFFLEFIKPYLFPQGNVIKGINKVMFQSEDNGLSLIKELKKLEEDE